MRRFDRLEFREGDTHLTGAAEQRHAQLQGPSDERHWLSVAGHDRRNGLHESALRHYSRALELDKSLTPGWVGQVQMLIALGEYPEAEVWSRKALELFKNNAELLAARAQALTRIGDLKAAQASCDAAIGQQGLSSYPWVARGDLMLARRERIDDYCFDKAVQLDSDWLVRLEIGDVYLYHGKPTKALSHTRQAVERAPDQAYCWYRQGACEMALGLTGAAERSFARCLQLVPNHAEAARERDKLAISRRSFGQFLKRLFRS